MPETISFDDIEIGDVIGTTGKDGSYNQFAVAYKGVSIGHNGDGPDQVRIIANYQGEVVIAEDSATFVLMGKASQLPQGDAVAWHDIDGVDHIARRATSPWAVDYSYNSQEVKEDELLEVIGLASFDVQSFAKIDPRLGFTHTTATD